MRKWIGPAAGILLLFAGLSISPRARAQAYYGDVNIDNAINVADATQILRTALGFRELTPEYFFRGDVAPFREDGEFGDGKINVQDAVRILRRAAGLEPGLVWPGTHSFNGPHTFTTAPFGTYTDSQPDPLFPFQGGMISVAPITQPLSYGGAFRMDAVFPPEAISELTTFGMQAVRNAQGTVERTRSAAATSTEVDGITPIIEYALGPVNASNQIDVISTVRLNKYIKVYIPLDADIFNNLYNQVASGLCPIRVRRVISTPTGPEARIANCVVLFDRVNRQLILSGDCLGLVIVTCG